MVKTDDMKSDDMALSKSSKEPEDMYLKLSKCSRSVENEKYKKGGILHKSAIGSIHYAIGTTEPSIIKTLDLESQNIFCVADSKKTTLRGCPKKNVRVICESKRDAKEWKQTWSNPKHWPERKNYNVSKIVWLEELVNEVNEVNGVSGSKDGATKIIHLNEYLCEAFVGFVLSKQMKVPHFIKTYDAYIYNRQGHILQEHAGLSLYKNMSDLSLKEFKSIIMQIIVTLAMGQTFFFKHHDTHLDNVFYTRKDEMWKSKSLMSKPIWSYRPDQLDPNFQIYIRHEGILAKLGDYGLSSITDLETKTRYVRADYSILNAGEEEWGEWSSNLETQWSYDIAVLLSKFFLSDEVSTCSKENYSWAQNLYVEIQKVTGMECSNIGRPFRGKEGNIKIIDLLKLPIFKEFHSLATESTESPANYAEDILEM